MPLSLILVSCVIAAGDPPRPESKEDRERRAAMIDRIMAEPVPPHLRSDKSLTIEETDPEPEAQGDEEEEAVIKASTPRGGSRLDRSNFDRWMFGSKVDDQWKRDWLHCRLDSKIERVASRDRLRPVDVEKLRLAGRGDIKRFHDRVEGMRAKFEAARSNIEKGRAFLTGELRPLSDEFQVGPFGDGSLFAKTLKRIEQERVASRPPM